MVGSREQGYATLKQLAGDLLLSPIEEYANNRTLLTFQCNQPGCENTYHDTSFLYQKTKRHRMCPKCREKSDRICVKDEHSKQRWIDKCREVHGDYYSYELVPEQFTQTEPLTIICPKHGKFQMTGDVHKRGSGCSHCKIDKVTQATRSTKTEFIIKANKVHNFKYNYDLVEYQNAITPVTIQCSKHGAFEQTPDVHLHGSGCPRCTTSKPVQEIMEALDTMGLTYIPEKTFDGCVGVDGGKLIFDIFIPEKNICIEYDGIHHYRLNPQIADNEKAQQALEHQQQNDQIKNQFCEENNIKLARIPYTDNHPGATITQYLKQIPNERVIYSWDDYKFDIRKIVNYINSFGYERFAIYGISRGGLIPAVHLSNLFDDVSEFGVIKFQRYDGNDKIAEIQVSHQTKDIPIFVIDDLISSGITMEKAVRKLNHTFKKATVHPIVIFGEENDGGIFFINPHPKQWIVFPYETT